MFASKEADNRFNYSEELVRAQCWHAVVTGLRNDNVKNEVKTALASRDPEDEEVLEILNKSVSDEERQGKMKEMNAKVNAVEQKKSEVCTVEKVPKENPILTKLDEVVEAMKDLPVLRNKVEILEEQVRTASVNAVGTGLRYGCNDCKKNNIRKCTNCFKCGETDHKKDECPKN